MGPTPNSPPPVNHGAQSTERVTVGATDISGLYLGSDLIWPKPSDFDGVVFSTTGDSFSPTVELAAGSDATVHWLDDQGTELATGLTPTISFGSVANRQVSMHVVNQHQPAYGDIQTVNLGFNSTDDAGHYNIGPSYNKSAQAVAAVSGLGLLSGLRRFLAANGNLAGNLDFTGLNQLEFIECFRSDVESVDLTGCTSLIRLCLEAANVSSLDLNPAAGNIRDLRAAIQQGGNLAFTTLVSPLAMLYHLCVRDQVVTNHPPFSDLPVVEELWNWNTGQTGALAPISPALTSLLTYSNGYSTADLTSSFKTGTGGRQAYLYGNPLTSIDLTGCVRLNNMRFYGPNMNLATAEINRILIEVESWGTSGGRLDMRGGSDLNEGPTSTGQAAADLLTGRSWTIDIHPMVIPSDSEEPTVPADVAVIAVTDMTATVTWTASTDNIGVTGYQIRVGGSGGAVETTTGTSLNLYGLAESTSYDIEVRAGDAAENWSAWSTAVNFTTAETPPEPTIYWEDDFERADATGIAAVGNNWTTTTDSDASIVGGQLVWSGTEVYHRAVNPASGNVPADFAIEIGIPVGVSVTPYVGVIARTDASGDGGVKIVTDQFGDLRVGPSATYTQQSGIDVTPVNPMPDSWAQTGFHTMRVELEGDQIRVILDGVHVGTATYAGGMTVTAGSVGLCGEPRDRAFEYIRTVSLTVGHADDEAPTVPTNLVASNIEANSAAISWNPSSDNVGVTGYEIRRGGSGGPTVTSAVASIGLTGLASETSYSVDVRARDLAGNWSGWSTPVSFTTDAASTGPTLLWEDTFDRANATGIANIGSEWSIPVGNGDASIVNNSVVRTGANQYGLLIATPSTPLPADYTVEIEFPHTSMGTFWGVAAGWDGSISGSTNGVKAFFLNNAQPIPRTRIGNAGAPAGADEAGTYPNLNPFPATWTDPGTHTLALRLVGAQATLIADGVEVHQGTIARNVSTTGTGVGFCGEPQNREWYAIRVYSIG